MKCYVFMADGFEVLELFSTVDVLKRCGAEVITVSIKDDLKVENSQKNLFLADKLIKEIDYKDGNAVVIPGGFPGYVNLRENKEVVKIVDFYFNNNKCVAAICGGPTILSHNKIACGKNLTAHSSVKDSFDGTHNYTNSYVCVDGNLITGIGAGHSIDFAFKIAEKFFDDVTIEKVKKSMEL